MSERDPPESCPYTRIRRAEVDPSLLVEWKGSRHSCSSFAQSYAISQNGRHDWTNWMKPVAERMLLDEMLLLRGGSLVRQIYIHILSVFKKKWVRKEFQ